MSLEDQDPFGRLDVAAYRMSQRVIQELESYWGVPGLWDMIKIHVEDGINDIRLKKVPQPLLEAIEKVIEARQRR